MKVDIFLFQLLYLRIQVLYVVQGVKCGGGKEGEERRERRERRDESYHTNICLSMPQ